MSYRAIPFDRVVENLRSRKYRGKMQALDYANTGIQLFLDDKFSAHLGVSSQYLQDIGLVRIEDFSGWKLPAEPEVEALLQARERIEAARLDQASTTPDDEDLAADEKIRQREELLEETAV